MSKEADPDKKRFGWIAGLSIWTIICIILFIIGLMIHDSGLSAFAVIMYLVGWLIRGIFALFGG